MSGWAVFLNSFGWVGVLLQGGLLWWGLRKNKKQLRELLTHWKTFREVVNRMRAREQDLIKREILFEVKCRATGIVVEMEEITPDFPGVSTPTTRH